MKSQKNARVGFGSLDQAASAAVAPTLRVLQLAAAVQRGDVTVTAIEQDGEKGVDGVRGTLLSLGHARRNGWDPLACIKWAMGNSSLRTRLVRRLQTLEAALREGGTVRLEGQGWTQGAVHSLIAQLVSAYQWAIGNVPRQSACAVVAS